MAKYLTAIPGARILPLVAKILPLRSEPAQQHPALHARAMDNLAFIRDAMEAAGSFTAVSGWGMVAAGVVALSAAAVAAMQPTVARWLDVWLAAAVLAPVVLLWAILAKSRASGIPLLSSPGRKFILSFSPPMFVGALLTVVLLRRGLIGLLPGTWLLLYGTAVVAGGAFSVEIVPVMGFCFMLAGTLALFTPFTWANWIMAAAFGGLHIVFGIPIARRHGG